jgi:hypothetical protein
MFWRKKVPPVGHYYNKAKKRLANQSTVDLLEWADNSGTVTSKSLRDYSRKERHVSGLEHLVEARKEIEVNLAIIDILLDRENPLSK